MVVWCSFTRSIARLDFAAKRMTIGPELVASTLTDEQHRGMVLFERPAPEISQGGSLACATCHPDAAAQWESIRQLMRARGFLGEFESNLATFTDTGLDGSESVESHSALRDPTLTTGSNK